MGVTLLGGLDGTGFGGGTYKYSPNIRRGTAQNLLQTVRMLSECSDHIKKIWV